MGKLQDFTAKIFGGRGQSAPKNEMVMSRGVVGSELYTLLTGDSSSGIAVTEKSALSTSAVYASVGLIGGAVASLPFHLYKRTSDGRERHDSDLWWLFNESPSGAWTSASAWQYTMQSILLKGDSFWIIKRATRYSPIIEGFEPVHPDKVTVQRVDGRNQYIVKQDDGTQKGFDQDDVLHFTGLGFDGLRSITPISYALRYAAGTTSAADQHAASFFKGGAKPDHAIEVPEGVKMTEDQREQLKEMWGKQRANYVNSGGTPVLTGGMKVTPLTLNAKDAQLLETRQFGVEEIARIFGVPPHMIGKTDASTSWGSGIEQMSIGFARYTLRRHLDVIQQEINRKVWPRSRMFFGEFSMDALMDGDSKAQAEYFSKALGGPGTQGWMTVNEVRKLKNLKPLDGQDELVQSGAAAAEAGAAKQDQQAQQTQQALHDLSHRMEAMASKPAEQPVINVAPVINVDNKMPDQPAPVVNTTVNVPEQQAPVVNNTVNVPESVINVEAIMPEQVVNIEAVMPAQPAPTVNLAPAIVNVTPEVNVNLPARKTETTIERDRNGNIVRATQHEEDAS